MTETTPEASETPRPTFAPPEPPVAIPEPSLTGSGVPATVASLRDPVPNARPVPLDGPFERHGFPPLLLAAAGLIAAFLVYNVVGGLVLGVGLLLNGGLGGGADAAAMQEAALGDLGLLLVSNAAGQAAGFALFTLWLARGHARQIAGFLRLRRPDGVGMALAVAGFAALVPLVQWLAALTQGLPYPEWLEWMRELEASQDGMIREALSAGGPGLAFLLLTVAVAPAICEELLFRGYLQRQAERRLGPIVAIALIGVLFGLYHLRLTQALPLAALGVYLAYLTWATSSLWPAVVVHLLNNGLTVVAADYVRRHPELDPGAVEALPTPWYLALASALLTAVVARALLRRRAALAAASSAAPLPTALR